MTPDHVRTAGIGLRDDAGAPVTADTPFEIGSVTKAMTSMLLADETASDAVRLDATVGEVLGDVPWSAGGRSG